MRFPRFPRRSALATPLDRAVDKSQQMLRQHQALATKQNMAPNGPIGPSSTWQGGSLQHGVAQQSPISPMAQDTQKAQSNTRFRSFAERYIVERCRDWKEGEVDERAWATILEAKSIYKKVREVSRTLGDDT